MIKNKSYKEKTQKTKFSLLENSKTKTKKKENSIF